MGMREQDFANEVNLVLGIHSGKLPAETTAELLDICTALAAETGAHDRTIDAPASPILRHGVSNGITAPTAGWKTRFGNDMLLLINEGKAANLSNATMIAAIDSAQSLPSKPGVIDVPYLSGVPPYANGSTISCTSGNWVGTPTSYTYQFQRDGTNFGGNTSTATYTVSTASDSGHQITCVVTATNAQGSTVAPASNAIRVP